MQAHWLGVIEQIQSEGLAKTSTWSKPVGSARLPKPTRGLAGFRASDLKTWMSRSEDVVKLSGPLAGHNLGELSFGDIRNLQSLRGEALVGDERLPVSALAPAELLSGGALASADIPTYLAAFHPERGEAVVLVATGETQWPIILTGLPSSWRDVAEVELMASVWSSEHGQSTSGQLILEPHAEDAFKRRPGLRRFRLVLGTLEKL